MQLPLWRCEWGLAGLWILDSGTDRNRKMSWKPINTRTFNFYKLKYRHKYRHLVVSCRFIELWSNLVSLLLPSYSAHLKLYLHPTPSKFQPIETPPTPYHHLLAMGLLPPFTLYFAQTMSLRKAPLAFWNVLGGVYINFWRGCERSNLVIVVNMITIINEPISTLSN